MKQRKLAGSIESSVIGFGGGSISGSSGGYGYGDISEKDAIRVLQHAFEKGITLFDTAPIYGFGSSEERIGKALSGHRDVRSKITLVTKLGVDWDDERNVRTDNSPDTIKRMLEKSLRDLRTDYVDVYMIHWPDSNTPIEVTMKTLSEYRHAGVIRAIGASNFGIELLAKANAVDRIEVIQSEFNAFNNTNAKQLFEHCRTTGTGFMAYGTLAKGILSGRVTKSRVYDPSDFRGKVAFVQKQAENLAALQQDFLGIAKEQGLAPEVLATAYVLNYVETSVALVGMKSEAQVDSLFPAAEVNLPASVVARLDAMCAVATPLYLSTYGE